MEYSLKRAWESGPDEFKRRVEMGHRCFESENGNQGPVSLVNISGARCQTLGISAELDRESLGLYFTFLLACYINSGLH